ncbi:MAG: hypothetical protein ACI9HK_005127 [Pirellulaceae bacterium]|jgi:hypothetical protein
MLSYRLHQILLSSVALVTLLKAKRKALEINVSRQPSPRRSTTTHDHAALNLVGNELLSRNMAAAVIL